MNLSGKRMILFGGCSDIETFDDAYEFSFDTLKWDKLDCASPFGPKNYQLADHSACIYNGRLITFFGGTYTANGQLTTLTHELTFGLLLLHYHHHHHHYHHHHYLRITPSPLILSLLFFLKN